MNVCVCRMDSDYNKVPVGAASEGGRVLPTVSQSRLQLTTAGHSCRRGDGHEAVGIQREARHVHVSGQSARCGVKIGRIYFSSNTE